MGGDGAAAEPLAARPAAHGRAVLAFACSRRHWPSARSATAASRSDSLTRSSSSPCISVSPSAKDGGHRQHRIFVDHRRRALGRHGDALQLGSAHAQIRDILAAGIARIDELDRRRPSPAASVIRPVRVGFISTFSMVMSEPGTISAATSGKPAEDGSPGTAMIWPVSLPWPSMRMWRTPSLSVSTVEIGAKALQHLFGVVARHHRLDDGGDARRVEAGQQHGRLDLRGGHRHAVGDRRRGARAAQRDRHAVAGGGLQHLDAHLAQADRARGPSAASTARRRR